MATPVKRLPFGRTRLRDVLFLVRRLSLPARRSSSGDEAAKISRKIVEECVPIGKRVRHQWRRLIHELEMAGAIHNIHFY